MTTGAYIYSITSPTGNIYIGQTINLHKRLSSYRRHECKNQKALYRSFEKYGFDDHSINILHELPPDINRDILSLYETLYIAQYKSCGLTLLNLTDGGGGMVGYKHSSETKLKLSITSKRKRKRVVPVVHSEETRRKMTLSRIGKKPSAETLARMSIAQRARQARLKALIVKHNG